MLNFYRVGSLSDPTRDDYGYSLQNPIEVVSVALEYQYLNAMETEKGKAIKYHRLGSFTGAGGELVDGYEIFVQLKSPFPGKADFTRRGRFRRAGNRRRAG